MTDDDPNLTEADLTEEDLALFASWERFHRRKPVAIAIMLFGLAGVFGIGFGMDLFGKPIAFDTVPPYLLLVSIWIGIFGGLWATGTTRRALLLSSVFPVILAVAYTAGQINRAGG